MRTLVVVLAVLAVTGWGAALGLGAAVLALQEDDGVAALPGLVVSGRDAAADGTAGEGPASDAYALTVHEDGCGVVRTEGPGGQDLDGLTWSVVDAAGFQVLGRDALGETRYRFFIPGTYEVVLEAWGGQSYVPVSNTVTITC